MCFIVDCNKTKVVALKDDVRAAQLETVEIAKTLIEDRVSPVEETVEELSKG